VRQFPQDTVVAGHPTSTGTIDDSEDESNRRTARVVLRLVGLTIPVAAVVLYFNLSSRRATSIEAEPVATKAVRTDAPPAASLMTHIGVSVTARRPSVLTAAVDGQPSVDIHLGPGGQHTFDAQQELMLTLSDPTAVDLTINGSPGRELGPAGVITTVRLTPDNYKGFVAAQ